MNQKFRRKQKKILLNMNCQFWEHLDGDGVEDKTKKSHVILHGFLFCRVSFIIDYVTNLILQLFFKQKEKNMEYIILNNTSANGISEEHEERHNNEMEVVFDFFAQYSYDANVEVLDKDLIEENSHMMAVGEVEDFIQRFDIKNGADIAVFKDENGAKRLGFILYGPADFIQYLVVEIKPNSANKVLVAKLSGMLKNLSKS